MDSELWIWRRKRKEEIISETKQSIAVDMKARRLQWTGNVARGHPTCPFFLTINDSIIGTISRGSLRFIWVDRIKKD